MPISLKPHNIETYQKFIEYLISIKDEEYKKFHSSLVLNSKYEMIGIRLPIMRKIAKEISKTNIEEFLKYSSGDVFWDTPKKHDKYYEEIMIQGLVISSIKDEEKFYKYFKNHINKIDNWALCDSFCNSIKIVEKYEEKYFPLSIEMCLNEDEFISRIGLVTILSHFVEEKNLAEIFEMLNKIKSDKFYINMAQAWLVCELYIKHPKETMEFIKHNNLNKFTHNKAISKIHDSYRVSKEDKEYLNGLRK